MAISRTAKGTVSNKSSDLTLSISDVEITSPSTLLVLLAYDSGSGHPEVSWGPHQLMMRARVSGGGLACRVYKFFKRHGQHTNEVIATWTTTAPTSKVMIATEISEVNRIDRKRVNSQLATTTPSSGALRNSNYVNEIFIGALASEGPPTDTVGTPANSYSSGQRVGVSGAPPLTNITLHEIYKIVSTKESTRARKTGATERDWCSILVMLHATDGENLLNTRWECSECGFQSDVKRDFLNVSLEMECTNCGEPQ